MVNKRAQAAMEFLMTYGWAIMVVLVVIGAFAYFGILNPNTLLPEKCQVQMGLYCKDHLASTNSTNNNGSILLTLENGRGSDIKIHNITATTDAFGGTTVCVLSNDGDDTLLRNGAKVSFKLNGSGNPDMCGIPAEYKNSNTKVKWDLMIKWFSVATGSEYMHTASGELMSVIE